MAEYSLTLAALKFANVTNFSRSFGTKKTALQNAGSLTTEECNIANATPFDIQRPLSITETSIVSNIQYDAKIVINATSSITLTLNSAQYAGCKVILINNTALSHTLSCTSVISGNAVPHLLPHAIASVMWNGSAWQAVGGKNVGETYTQEPQQESPFDVFPCSDWVELISHNGAFKRTANAPTTLWATVSSSPTKVYSDEDLQNPVEYTGLGTISATGTSKVNTFGQTIYKYTGTWTSGKASNYIGKSDSLVKQKAQLPRIVGNHYEVEDPSSESWTGAFKKNHNIATNTLANGAYKAFVTRSVDFDSSFTNASTDINGENIYTANGENRPENMTYRLWKRIA